MVADRLRSVNGMMAVARSHRAEGALLASILAIYIAKLVRRGSALNGRDEHSQHAQEVLSTGVMSTSCTRGGAPYRRDEHSRSLRGLQWLTKLGDLLSEDALEVREQRVARLHLSLNSATIRDGVQPRRPTEIRRRLRNAGVHRRKGDR